MCLNIFIFSHTSSKQYESSFHPTKFFSVQEQDLKLFSRPFMNFIRVRERERETERERENERQRDRETERERETKRKRNCLAILKNICLGIAFYNKTTRDLNIF